MSETDPEKFPDFLSQLVQLPLYSLVSHLSSAQGRYFHIRLDLPTSMTNKENAPTDMPWVNLMEVIPQLRSSFPDRFALC